MSEVQLNRIQSEKPALIVIVGPTASGKTAAAVEVSVVRDTYLSQSLPRG